VNVYIIRWHEKRSTMNHGVMPGCFFDPVMARTAANVLGERDGSLVYYVEPLSIFESIPTSWTEVRREGGKPQRPS
jgi:hypothetical protein